MKNKRQKREAKNQAVKNQRQNRIRALLVQLGIWDELSGPKIRDYLLKAYDPPIELSVSANVPTDERIQTHVRELKQAVQKATFDCPLLGQDYSIVDYFMYAVPLVNRLVRVRDAIAGLGSQGKLERIVSIIDVATCASAMDEAFWKVYFPILWGRGRIDEYLYFLRWDSGVTPHGRSQLRMLIDRVQPERRMIEKDNERRAAYRCGITAIGGVNWIEWPSSAIGLTNEERNYPVFVQRHVLERLYGREGRLLCGEFEGAVHYYLALSLSDPRIHPRNGGSFLVEYHLHEFKVGYLVARKLDDLILVETFLFLTMDGTPEGTQLWKQLKLDRSGKQYTELDNLSTFLVTDLALDPGLVKILENCGCGHLFELGKELGIKEFVPGYAADIRKYLSLDDWQRPKLSSNP